MLLGTVNSPVFWRKATPKEILAEKVEKCVLIPQEGQPSMVRQEV